MNITSLLFALFSLIAVVVYWLLPQRFRIAWLFAGSLVFVITWSWELAGILLVVATVNFLLGKWIGRAEKQGKAVLWAGIVFNILVLLALRYSEFYVVPLSVLLGRLGVRTDSGGLQLLVPIGLGFVAVQMISYLVDVNKRIAQPEARWLDFALYVLYFPKMLSGPIERARTFLPALRQPKPVDMEAVERSVWLVVIGLIRKLLLADALMRLLPADVFTSPEKHLGIDLIFYLLVLAFGIYNDFAGYTSIARGVSGFFGIELSANFNLPYFSRNFNEFWERWHISLSNWLRDYIFFPLSRALHRKVPRREHLINVVVPPIATMLVSGLWHGVGLNFLVWGGLHGVYLVVERLLSLRGPRKLPDELPRWRRTLSALVVFTLVVLAWIPFRMTLATSLQYVSHMFSSIDWARLLFWFLRKKIAGQVAWDNWIGIDLPDLRWVILLAPALLLDWAQHRSKNEIFPARWPAWARALFLAVVVLLLFLASFVETGAPFIYQVF